MDRLILYFMLGKLWGPQLLHVVVQGANVGQQNGWKSWLGWVSVYPGHDARLKCTEGTVLPLNSLVIFARNVFLLWHEVPLMLTQKYLSNGCDGHGVTAQGRLSWRLLYT